MYCPQLKFFPETRLKKMTFSLWWPPSPGAPLALYLCRKLSENHTQYCGDFQFENFCVSRKFRHCFNFLSFFVDTLNIGKGPLIRIVIDHEINLTTFCRWVISNIVDEVILENSWSMISMWITQTSQSPLIDKTSFWSVRNTKMIMKNRHEILMGVRFKIWKWGLMVSGSRIWSWNSHG